MSGPVIGVAGAGSIGCFVGGALAHAGKPVRFLARRRVVDAVAAHGLTVTDLSGFAARLAPDALAFSDDAACLAGADIILVCVKSGATASIAADIAAHAAPDAVVVSLQNGVANADILRAALPGRDIRAGMVGYNVLDAGAGRYHRGTAGTIIIGAGAGDIAGALRTPHLDIAESADMPAVQWGKLLINLNNALNALSGLPLREEMLMRGWRTLLADQMDEALAALDADGVAPRRATPLPPRRVPAILRLPTPLYRLIGGRSLKIDPEARSSMWEDLRKGRKTEINELQGAAIALAAKHGLDAPVNQRVAALIAECEERGRGSPALTPDAVRAGIFST